MTDEMIKRLIAAGLSKQQASSVTAETLVNLFMNDDGRTLIREAQRQVLRVVYSLSSRAVWMNCISDS